jgi:hypothetical protein
MSQRAFAGALRRRRFSRLPTARTSEAARSTEGRRSVGSSEHTRKHRSAGAAASARPPPRGRERCGAAEYQPVRSMIVPEVERPFP